MATPSALFVAAFSFVAPQIPAAQNHIIPCHRQRTISLFFGGGSLPSELASIVPDSIQPSEVAPLWRELRKCYPSESAAIAAAKKQPLIILPFFNTAETITLCHRILGDELGFTNAERLEIITLNPGVLANKPYELASSTQDEVRSAMKMVSTIESIPEPIRFAIPTVTVIAIVGVIAKRLSDCAGGICG